MTRRLVVLATFVGSLLGIDSIPALADEVRPSPAFGQHVSEMAPEHPQIDGASFRACVSAMASGADYPHG